MNIVNYVKIAWFGKHFGEEPPLVGKKGAGTIFFSGCNLRCVYCQNYQISQQNIGKKYTIQELADIMLKLQNQDALNIDLVTPTIWADQIKRAILKAKKQGLSIPIIWNSNAHEEVEMIKRMKGLIDIYLPDFKYGNNDLALKYSNVENYVEKAKESIKEMFHQVGNLKLLKNKTAKKGLIVRHLVLPDNIENSLKVLGYIKEIDKDIYINLMSQYEPVYKAKKFPEINRNIKKKEFEKIFNYALKLGFKNGWIQDTKNQSMFLPDFTKENPFSNDDFLLR
jgi:putative pyruvate formate lyase activating enzyme